MSSNDNNDDTQMHSFSSASSSPDVDSEEMMFPHSSSAIAQDDSNPSSSSAHLRPLSSELSPPNSQTGSSAGVATTAPNMMMPYGDAMDFMPSPQIGSAGGGAIDGGVEARNGPYSGSRGEEKPPGSAWNNKKAHDDCRRAMDGLLDDKFSLRDLGDPFDENDMTTPN